jgi:hypothetical protein
MKLVFIGDGGVVMNVIISNGMSDATKQVFIDEASRAYGAVWAFEVPDGASVWIGGTYDAEQGFLPPAQPEPEPEVIEGTATLMPTEQPIELQEQV